jgi:hypothetical protein
MDERAMFVRLVQMHGTPGPATRRMEIQPEITPGETDCWTHAYRYAQAHPGSQYVEGICFTEKGDVVTVHAHAWVEEVGPFGTMLVELTDGYQRARDYRGIPIDLTHPAAARAQHGEIRYSVLELDIALQALNGEI